MRPDEVPDEVSTSSIAAAEYRLLHTVLEDPFPKLVKVDLLFVRCKKALVPICKAFISDLFPLLRFEGLATLLMRVEVELDVLCRERDQRRTAIDHATNRNPVALAKGRDAEHVAEGIEGHCMLGL